MRSRLSAILIILALLTPNLYFIRAALTDDLQSEINQKEQQIKNLESQIASYNKMLSQSKTQSATLKQEISKMETQIKSLEAQVRLTQLKISDASDKIGSLENDISTKTIQIEQQKNNLASIIMSIYEYDQQSPLYALLQNEDLSEFLSQMEYTSNLQAGMQDRLIQIKEMKTSMEGQKTEVEQQKADLEDLRSELNGKTSALDSQRDEQQDLLTATKNQEKQYQSTLNTLQKQRDQIEKEIAATEAKLRALIDQNSITGGKGAFISPTKGFAVTQTYGCIISSFARKSYPACTENKKSGGYHNGLDLDGNTGDAIYAVRDGVVSGVGNLGKYSYGKWITIKHDNGLTTLYGHLSAQSVKVGQKVTSGQIIGYMGSTGYSTGSHLHFTVYATNTFSIEQKWYGPVPLGGAVSPLLYL